MGINYEAVLGVPRPDLSDAYKEYDVEGTTFAHNALGQVPTNLVSGEIEAHTLAILKTADTTRASSVAAYNRGGIGISKVSFSLDEKGWEVPVAQAPGLTVQLNKDLAAMQECKAKIEIAYEKQFVAMAQNLTTFSTGNKNFDTTSKNWSDPTADILGDIGDAVSTATINSGTTPDTIFMNQLQYSYLMRNEGVRKSFGSSIITDAILRSTIPALYGLGNLVVTNSVCDDTAVGEAYAGALIWNSNYVQVCKLGAGMLSPSAFKKLVYTDDAGDIVVEEYPEPQTRCNIIRARQVGAPVLFNKNLGFLVKITTG